MTPRPPSRRASARVVPEGATWSRDRVVTEDEPYDAFAALRLEEGSVSWTRGGSSHAAAL